MAPRAPPPPPRHKILKPTDVCPGRQTPSRRHYKVQFLKAVFLSIRYRSHGGRGLRMKTQCRDVTHLSILIAIR